MKRAVFMDFIGNLPEFRLALANKEGLNYDIPLSPGFAPDGRTSRSACGGIYAVASLLCTSLSPAGRALANKEGQNYDIPLSPGFAPDGRTSRSACGGAMQIKK